MKMTEPYNLGLLALISAAGEISYEELKQRYLPPEQPGVIQGVTASFDNDIKTLEKEKYISVHGNIIRFIPNNGFTKGVVLAPDILLIGFNLGHGNSPSLNNSTGRAALLAVHPLIACQQRRAGLSTAARMRRSS